MSEKLPEKSQLEELRTLLSKTPFLAGFVLSESDLIRRRFPSGRYVTDQFGGEPCVGLVVSGRVGVYSAAADGNDIELTNLRMGDCFGICNLMMGDELETLLCCKEETTILFIPKRILLRQIEEVPARAVSCMEVCAAKLRFLLQRISELTIQSGRGRLISYLLTNEQQNGAVALSGSREDLARHLGISRSALFRELAALQTAGKIRTEGAMLYITDRPALERSLYLAVG